MAERVLLAETLYFSVITEIELLSARHLSEEERATIRDFLARCQRVELTHDIVERTIELRRSERLKTPDAIIVATALHLGVPLMTADKRLTHIPGLQIIADIVS